MGAVQLQAGSSWRAVHVGVDDKHLGMHCLWRSPVPSSLGQMAGSVWDCDQQNPTYQSLVRLLLEGHDLLCVR